MLRSTAVAFTAGLLAACGGGETAPAPAPAPTTVEAAPPPPPAPPPRHRGITARELGPEVSIGPDDQAAATAMIGGGIRASGWTQYGGSQAYFDADLSGVTNEQLQPRLLWIARSQSDVQAVVAAITKLGDLAGSGLDWPADREALLLGLLSHGDTHIASAAAEASRRALRSSSAVSDLVRETCTEHTDPYVRATACAAVRDRNPSLSEDTASLTTLVRAITDDHHMPQFAAIYALGSAMWATALPANTFDDLVTAHGSAQPMIRASSLEALADYARSNSNATQAQKDRVRELAVAALSDADGWVRSRGLSAVSNLGLIPQNLPRLREMLDDSARLTSSMPFAPLIIEDDSGNHEYGTSMGTRFPSNNVGAWALSLMADFATGSSRVPEDQRLQLANDSDEATARTAVLAWYDAHAELMTTLSQP